jgi:hypothetical protein
VRQSEIEEIMMMMVVVVVVVVVGGDHRGGWVKWGGGWSRPHRDCLPSLEDNPRRRLIALYVVQRGGTHRSSLDANCLGGSLSW